MNRPELAIHVAPLEPLGLELLIGLHPLDRFTKLVKIADGRAISVGIEEPLHGLRHHDQGLEGISVPVQSFQIIPNSAAILGRCRSPPSDAQRNHPTRINRENLLQPEVEFPIRREVVFIAKALSATQTEVGKRNPAGIFITHQAAPLWNPVVFAVNAKTVQVFATPVERDLESVMEFG